MRLLFRWLVTALVIQSLPGLLEGVQVEGFGSALAAAAVLGILNVIVRPLLVVLTFPLTILSLGIFLLVINAIIFYWAGALVSGLQVATFGTAFVAALFLSLVNWAFELSFDRKNGRRVVIIRHRPGPRGGGERQVRDLN